MDSRHFQSGLRAITPTTWLWKVNAQGPAVISLPTYFAAKINCIYSELASGLFIQNQEVQWGQLAQLVQPEDLDWISEV